MIWRIIWGTLSVLSVLGAIVAVVLAYAAACLVLYSPRWHRKPRRKRELPLFLLRARTWRQRRRNSKHLVIPDWGGLEFSSEEKAALRQLEEEIR